MLFFFIPAYKNPFKTETPTDDLRTDMGAIMRHSCNFGSKTSAEFNPVEPSKPPTAKIQPFSTATPSVLRLHADLI